MTVSTTTGDSAGAKASVAGSNDQNSAHGMIIILTYPHAGAGTRNHLPYVSSRLSRGILCSNERWPGTWNAKLRAGTLAVRQAECDERLRRSSRSHVALGAVQASDRSSFCRASLGVVTVGRAAVGGFSRTCKC
jgi:hypothetical protein